MELLLSTNLSMKEEQVKAAQNYQLFQEFRKRETVAILNQRYIEESCLQNPEHNKYQSPWMFPLFHKKVLQQVV